MATPTYTPLATITLSSAESSVTFSSIPQTYRDLIVSVAGTGTANAAYYLRVNGDSGSNYNTVGMKARSSGPESYADATQAQVYVVGNGWGTGGWFNSQIQLLDYSATDKHKSMLIRNGNYDNSYASPTVVGVAARWANNSAISSIYFSTNTSTFAVGTTFSLFGIAS